MRASGVSNTLHGEIRRILKEDESLSDEEVMLLLRQRWSPRGSITPNTYATKHAKWGRRTFEIIKRVEDNIGRLDSEKQSTERAELREAVNKADNGNRQRLQFLDRRLRSLVPPIQLNQTIEKRRTMLISTAPHNQILYGPPGTGKTYDAIAEAVKVIDQGCTQEERSKLKARFNDLRQKGRVEFVTFHQNYAYEDFIEGIRPVLDGGQLRYELRDGIFKRIALQASKDRTNRYVLIIDEINRGNIAKIFGELITLIESSKRLGAEDEARATLPYSQEQFGVPGNLYLIGTMNTADRGIALLDVALRRRFDSVPMMPDASHVEEDIEGVDGRALLRTINRRIIQNLDRDHQIGHTYFMGMRTIEELKRAFQAQVIPLLQEYFYDDLGKMRDVLNDNGFVTELRGTDPPVFDVASLDDECWGKVESYRQIYGSSSAPSAE